MALIKRKQNAANDELFVDMNSHYKNVNLIVEDNPTRILNTAFNVHPDDSMTTIVFRRPEKFPAFGTLKFLKGARGII